MGEKHCASNRMRRRNFVAYFSGIGLGSTLMPQALAATSTNAEEITTEMVRAAATIAGLDFSADEIEEIRSGLNGSFQGSYETIRGFEMENDVSPAFVFSPLPFDYKVPNYTRSFQLSDIDEPSPKTDVDLAFLSTRELGELIRLRRITSTELTKLYLARIKKHDPRLHCVVNLTEELALKQAARADEEIAAGEYRGPLHGIPWGAKDLLAVKGYPSTWGGSPYKDQVIDANATVYTRLTNAGAVLVAKLSMGALASGNRWFGGQTRTPWNPTKGSGGSSAGPGAATAAGLVGFSIGTETRGSIVSPSVRCAITGLRPTFGRVSRFGAMALSWTMDKIGPMCRSAEDCAIVFNAIFGPDHRDRSVIDAPFRWNPQQDISGLKVGYVESRVESQASYRQQLESIRSLGVQLVPIEIPDFPVDAMNFILRTEVAAAFDDLTRSGRDQSMRKAPEQSSWPRTNRLNRFVPAVEYIQANRMRSLLIERVHETFKDIDVALWNHFSMTNLTGHPLICLPHTFDDSEGRPSSLIMTGKLFGEPELLRIGHALQDTTSFHRLRPQHFT